MVSTICDGAATNVKALKILKDRSKIRAEKDGKEFRSCGFEVNGVLVNPIIDDPPHLIKLIRNHLLENNLVYTEGDAAKTAKWDHIIKLYESDSGFSGLRMSKLTEQHVLQHRIKKMKVPHCVKVLSATVSTLMNYTVTVGIGKFFYIFFLVFKYPRIICKIF